MLLEDTLKYEQEFFKKKMAFENPTFKARKFIATSSTRKPISRWQTRQYAAAGLTKYSKMKKGISGFVNGTRKSVIADTGSAENVISASYASDMKLNIQHSSHPFQLGNSRTIQSIGESKIQ